MHALSRTLVLSVHKNADSGVPIETVGEWHAWFEGVDQSSGDAIATVFCTALRHSGQPATSAASTARDTLR